MQDNTAATAQAPDQAAGPVPDAVRTAAPEADAGQDAHIIHIIDARSHDGWLAAQPEAVRALLAAQGFRPKGYAHAILPGTQPDRWSVVTCVANREKLSSWCLARLAEVEDGDCPYFAIVMVHGQGRRRPCGLPAGGPR